MPSHCFLFCFFCLSFGELLGFLDFCILSNLANFRPLLFQTVFLPFNFLGFQLSLFYVHCFFSKTIDALVVLILLVFLCISFCTVSIAVFISSVTFSSVKLILILIAFGVICISYTLFFSPVWSVFVFYFPLLSSTFHASLYLLYNIEYLDFNCFNILSTSLSMILIIDFCLGFASYFLPLHVWQFFNGC